MLNECSEANRCQPRQVTVRHLADGVRLEAEVSLCVFIYPDYPLQIQATLYVNDKSAGQATAVRRGLSAETATQTDVVALLDAIRIQPCIHCQAPAFDPSTVTTNRDGVCEECFLRQLQEQFDRESQAEARRIANRDRRMKAKGMKYRVSAWIHPSAGEDYQVDWYEPHSPSREEVERGLQEWHSVVLDDYQLVKL